MLLRLLGVRLNMQVRPWHIAAPDVCDGMSAVVEGFGCRPMATMRLAPGLHRGRRPKAFNERNRDGRRLVVRLALWEFECRG